MQQIKLAENSPLRSKDFIFGVATAAFQIEGAAERREPCIWDTFCAEPGRIRDGSDGQVACDHINRWQDDIELVSSLGVDAYRFSVAWGRVIRADGSINQEGLQFYLDLLTALQQLQIKAFVTLYHWDLPQYLQDKGGWLNRETAYRFAEYADVISKAFGDKVYSYATLNEPFCSAYLGYEAGIHAPGEQNRQHGRQAAHHLLLAHGLALKVLRQNSPHALNGIVLNFSPCFAATSTESDQHAAWLADQYHNQWYLQPLIEGSYPDLSAYLSAAELPDVMPGDLALIAQPLDFLGINYYTRTVFEKRQDGWFHDVKPTQPPLTDMGWEIYPQGLTEILLQLHQRYQLPPIYITENGAAMVDELQQDQVLDADRLAYYQSHLLATEQAIKAGVDVRGYFAWSLLDNFEWAEGYAKRFGIVYVDYHSQQRTVKASGRALQQLWLSRK